MRLCLIYSSALHYREAIFRLMDCEFQCDFVFGDSQHGIRQMDTSVLSGHVTVVHACEWHGWNWQPKVVRQLCGDYDAYILLGDTRGLAFAGFKLGIVRPDEVFKGMGKFFFLLVLGFVSNGNDAYLGRSYSGQ